MKLSEFLEMYKKAAPLVKRKSGPVTVEDLLRAMEAGHFRIPDTQRAFCWKKDHVIKLLTSVLRRFPIPSIIVWDGTVTSSADEARPLRRFLAHYAVSDALPLYDEFADPAYLVVDGQQRLQSILLAFEGSWTEDGTREELYWDLNCETDEHTLRFQASSDAPGLVSLLNLRRWVSMTEADRNRAFEQARVPRERAAPVVAKVQRALASTWYLQVFGPEDGFRWSDAFDLFRVINKNQETVTAAELRSAGFANADPDYRNRIAKAVESVRDVIGWRGADEALVRELVVYCVQAVKGNDTVMQSGLGRADWERFGQACERAKEPWAALSGVVAERDQKGLQKQEGFVLLAHLYNCPGTRNVDLGSELVAFRTARLACAAADAPAKRSRWGLGSKPLSEHHPELCQPDAFRRIFRHMRDSSALPTLDVTHLSNAPKHARRLFLALAQNETTVEGLDIDHIYPKAKDRWNSLPADGRPLLADYQNHIGGQALLRSPLNQDDKRTIDPGVWFKARKEERRVLLLPKFVEKPELLTKEAWGGFVEARAEVIRACVQQRIKALD
jgi:hypothetical protein